MKLIKNNLLLCFAFVMICLGIISWMYCASDKQLTERENLQVDSTLMENFHNLTKIDSCKASQEFYTSTKMLLLIKNGFLNDLNDNYRFLCFFSLLFCVFSTVATIILFLITKNGWDHTESQYKFIFLCSCFMAVISYTVPRIMNNETNYKGSKSSFYSYKKQVIYSASIYERLKSKAINCNDIQTATDSNYHFMQENVNKYYDMNLEEIKSSFTELKEGFKK